MSVTSTPPDFRLVQSSVDAFVGWLSRTGFASHDPYDVWGTRYGLLARRLYYRKDPLGFALTGPVIVMEMLWPRLRMLFVRKERFATAHGQLAMGFLNLHSISGQPEPLETAMQLGGELHRLSIPGYSGHCWGYPFHWQNNSGLWKRNTPYITATPYAYEAFARLHDATRDSAHSDLAVSAARFVFLDLKDTPTSKKAAAASYSPHDASKVVNASAYRAFVLFDAARRFGLDAYREKAWRNLHFILENQREDGSWLYAVDNPAEKFIDHFHTCFVLKNLQKINLHLRDEAIRQAIHRGYAYYRRALFDAEDLPVSFAIRPRTQLVRREMYDFAEAITLGCVLKDEVPGAFDLACRLAEKLCRDYQLPAGHFITREYRLGLRHTMPYLRWPQAQLFFALTNVLVAGGTQNRGEATLEADAGRSSS
ncbi:MAG: hypothetical protein HZA90_27385 [Verrucomicrobia bacterium]|nr:hypothetical protein [Verrucomicrobiota bacterium]